MPNAVHPDSLTARALATLSNAELAEQLRSLGGDYQARPALAAVLSEAARRLAMLAEGKP
jgi:hypothetical protein